MTYDPDARVRRDVNPNKRSYERNAAGAWFLGAVVLVALGGLVFFSVVRSVGIARHEGGLAAPTTTGSGSALPRSQD
jgi:hypothetical protein